MCRQAPDAWGMRPLEHLSRSRSPCARQLREALGLPRSLRPAHYIPAHRPPPPPGTWSRKERDRGTPKPAHHSGPPRPPKAGSRLGHSATRGTGRVVSRPEQVVPRWRARRLATGAEARPPPRVTWPIGRARTGPSGQRPTTWRQLLQTPSRSQGRPSVRTQARRGAGGARFVTSARRRKGSFARLSESGGSSHWRRGYRRKLGAGQERAGPGADSTVADLVALPPEVGRNFLWS